MAGAASFRKRPKTPSRGRGSSSPAKGQRIDLGLKGSVALVSASSAGLGLATATELAREGAHVAMCGRKKETIEAAAAQVARDHGTRTLPVVADISTADGCAHFVDLALEEFGRIDTLVVNAGAIPGRPFGELDDPAWQAAIDLYFFPSIRLSRRALPALRATRGSIVVSTAASVREPGDYARWVASVSVRGAVHGLVKALVREASDAGVRVNAVMPGTFATDRLKGKLVDEDLATIPLRRFGEPQELAAVVAFLASKRAGFVNGASVVVDGGETSAVY